MTYTAIAMAGWMLAGVWLALDKQAQVSTPAVVCFAVCTILAAMRELHDEGQGD